MKKVSTAATKQAITLVDVGLRDGDLSPSISASSFAAAYDKASARLDILDERLGTASFTSGFKPWRNLKIKDLKIKQLEFERLGQV